MPKRKPVTEAADLNGVKLWDEILKSIVSVMPTQLFPLFKEVYGRDYPTDTSIVVLGSETSSFQENKKEPPDSTFMDLAFLVAGTDYYHLECQMKNDHEMIIRMFAYDVRFAITHSKVMDNDTGEIILYFPHSVVIYPEKNKAIPDNLQCRVVFQDNSEHIYKIPTVKIQTYSMKEIKQKHLTLFIPYTILRLRPKLKNTGKHSLTQKELTEFVEKAILVLREELADGYLTEQEYQDYVKLFQFAADRVLSKHPQMLKEVHRMTEPVIKLPSMIVAELLTEERAKMQAEMQAEQAKLQAEIEEQKVRFEEQKVQLENQNVQLEKQKMQLASKDAEIQHLQELVRKLSDK